MDKLPPPPPPPPPGHGRSPDQRPERSERSERNQRPDPTGDDDGRQTPTWVKRWLPWIAVGLFLVLVLVPTLTSGDNGDEIPYSEFIVLVEAGDVESLEWENESGKITGELNNGERFHTTGGATGPNDTDLALIRANVPDYDFTSPSSNWLLGILSLMLPILLIIGFFVWMQLK